MTFDATVVTDDVVSVQVFLPTGRTWMERSCLLDMDFQGVHPIIFLSQCDTWEPPFHLRSRGLHVPEELFQYDVAPTFIGSLKSTPPSWWNFMSVFAVRVTDPFFLLRTA